MHICSLFSGEQMRNYMLPLTQRLASGEWFTSRMSSCGLFACTYKGVDDASKAVLRYSTTSPVLIVSLLTYRLLFRPLFARLCEDSTPMVRRAACSHIGTRHCPSTKKY